MVCKNCNTENADSAIFCKTCGNRIDGKKICPVCNFANKEEDSFCSKCGARIDGKKFCANCGSEVEGLFCTSCGQKYGTPGSKKQSPYKKANDTLLGKIFDISGSSLLMLGAILSLILIFFIGYSSQFVEGNKIYYYFVDAYKNLSTMYPGSGINYYSASEEISAYLLIVMNTAVISISIIGCIIFSIISIVNYVRKMCFGVDKNPALYPLLSIAFYLICAISFRNVTYATVTGLEDLYEIEILQLNGATKTGIVLTSICALLYYVINVIGNALTLQKNQIAKFVVSIATTLSLIVVFILLSNCFVTANVNYEESYLSYKGSLILSFPMASSLLSSMSYTTEMIGGVIISGIVQILLIVSAFITLFALSNSMEFKNNTLSYTILISVLLILIVVSSSIAINSFADFIYEINIFESSNINKYLTINSSMSVVAFIISIIPLTTSIVCNVLDRKAE